MRSSEVPCIGLALGVGVPLTKLTWFGKSRTGASAFAQLHTWVLRYQNKNRLRSAAASDIYM